MRYGADHKQKTRQRILEAAAVVFRRRGFQAASVDDVMAEAGLTAGGFYAHFRSKEDLFAEAFLRTLEDARVIRGLESEGLEGRERIDAIVDMYLSDAHRRMVDQGCPMPPLLADLPRQSESTRRSFETAILEIAGGLSQHLSGEKPAASEERALAILATLIGGMSLGRAGADEALAERILTACRGLIGSSLSAADTDEVSRTSKSKSRSTSRKSSQKGKPQS